MTTPSLIVETDVIPVHADPAHEFTVETELVARGFGVSPGTLRMHKQRHADELSEGRHWVRVTNSDTSGPSRMRTFWTKRGIVRLGFFIKSERARRFRDAAEDLVLAPPPLPPPSVDARLDRLEKLLVAVAERVRTAPAAPLPAARRPSCRTHKSMGCSMSLELIAEAEKRRARLKMPWSAYVRGCVEFDLKHHLYENQYSLFAPRPRQP